MSTFEVVRNALAEDAPWGDITSETFVPPDAVMTATFVSRQDCVFVGAEVIVETFRQVDPSLVVQFLAEDGARLAAGDRIASVAGSARFILLGERVALNIVQRLSATATMTAQYVELVAGTKARIVDTRKTTPGLRQLEKHAVRCGGGFNHRHSLSDAVMVKDNHLAALLTSNTDVAAALREAKAKLGHTTHFEVEIDSLDQLDAVLAAEPDSVLLDNFSLADLRTAVELTNGRAILEASGGVNLKTVAAIAETGVDLISVGALTHSAGSIDIGLDVEPGAA